MTIQDDIKTLQNHESFARFIEMVHHLREECLSELHNASADQMQQISGRIITYDQLLQMTDWHLLQARFRDQLSL